MVAMKFSIEKRFYIYDHSRTTKVFVGGDLTETALAVGGALLFSLFIIYDTQVCIKTPFIFNP